MSRYARQTVLPEVGLPGQRALGEAAVLVVGAGGLGSALLPLLAGAGVGRLRVIDPDRVEESNLHRQTLYRMADLGRPKAIVAAEALEGLNPDSIISFRVARIDPVMARHELAEADLVIDAADSFAVSYALSDLCMAIGRPLVSASVLGRRGYVGGFCAGAPSLRTVFPDPPPTAESCATAGVMGPVVATLGALQAQMALSVLLGHEPSPLGQMLRLDLATWRISGFRFDGAPEPDPPFPTVIARSEIMAQDLVIDLRQNADAPQPSPGQRVVFICTTGLRAWRAAVALQDAGHHDVAIVGDGA
jgi:sulfur-carrier protein adenylyltransferase/sulfurtransferase